MIARQASKLCQVVELFFYPKTYDRFLNKDVKNEHPDLFLF